MDVSVAVHVHMCIGNTHHSFGCGKVEFAKHGCVRPVGRHSSNRRLVVLRIINM